VLEPACLSTDFPRYLAYIPAAPTEVSIIAEYGDWSRRMLASGTALVVPTGLDGETILRLCIVNPRTTVDDLRLVLDTLAEG